MSESVICESWLPLFPGFYHTIFSCDYDEEREFECISDLRRERKLGEIDDYYMVAEVDYTQFEYDTSKECCSAIEDFLNQLGIDAKVKIDNVYSPREYNFRNDSINATFEFPEGTSEIRKLVYKHFDAIAKRIKDHHTSCSGFISFHSNDIDDWREETEDFTSFKDSYNLGFILESVLLCEDYTTESLYYSVRDAEVYFTSEYIENYTQLTEQRYCEECEEFYSDLRKQEYEKQLKRDKELWPEGKEPKFYSYEEWVEKALGQDPCVCEYCHEELECTV